MFLRKGCTVLEKEQEHKEEEEICNQSMDSIASFPIVTQQDLNGFRHSVDQIFTAVDKLEKQVNEVENFYHSIDVEVVKEWEKNASRRKAASAKRMQELMRQFSTILRQITQHKWAGPFMDPVDAEGLGLYDYCQIIEKPMDFSTIRSKMEAKDGSGYENVREIYSDVRLTFKNAMKYNDEEEDVHIMAKYLLQKFEEKWQQFLPKVAEEEKRQLEEDAMLSQEAIYANMAKDIRSELNNVDMYLKGLKDIVIRKFRKLSTREKIELGTGLTRLSPENLSRALEIVAENNSTFQPSAEEVDLDIDAQSDCTLRRLKAFVKEALEVQGRTAGDIAVKHSDKTVGEKNNSKRERELCDSLAKKTVKKTKKPSTLIHLCNL